MFRPMVSAMIRKVGLRGEARVDAAALVGMLDARERLPPSDFVAVCDRFSATYGRFDWTPRVRGVSPARSYRIKAVGVLGRETFCYVVVLWGWAAGLPAAALPPPAIWAYPGTWAAQSWDGPCCLVSAAAGCAWVWEAAPWLTLVSWLQHQR